MREKLNHLYVDSKEKTILLLSLVELKNQLIQQGDTQTLLTNLSLKSVTPQLKN